MKIIFCATISMVASLLSCHAAAQDAFLGAYITGDNSSIVSLERCADNPLEVCGYLIGFEPTGKTQADRAMCRFRILGGLTAHKEKLRGGWVMDIEADEIYKLTIRKGRTASTIKLVIYETIESLSTTIIWQRNRESAGQGTPPICPAWKAVVQARHATP